MFSTLKESFISLDFYFNIKNHHIWRDVFFSDDEGCTCDWHAEIERTHLRNIHISQNVSKNVCLSAKKKKQSENIEVEILPIW